MFFITPHDSWEILNFQRFRKNVLKNRKKSEILCKNEQIFRNSAQICAKAPTLSRMRRPRGLGFSHSIFERLTKPGFEPFKYTLRIQYLHFNVKCKKTFEIEVGILAVRNVICQIQGRLFWKGDPLPLGNNVQTEFKNRLFRGYKAFWPIIVSPQKLLCFHLNSLYFVLCMQGTSFIHRNKSLKWLLARSWITSARGELTWSVTSHK